MCHRLFRNEMNKIKITVHQLVIAASLTLIVNILTIWHSGSVSLHCTKIQVSRLRNRSSIRPNTHLADFLKTNLSTFAVIWAKRRQKVGYQWARIRSKITLTKEKVRRTRKSEEEERRRREEKKRLHALLVFIMAILEKEKEKLLDKKGPFGGNVFKTLARHTIPFLIF